MVGCGFEQPGLVEGPHDIGVGTRWSFQLGPPSNPNYDKPNS